MKRNYFVVFAMLVANICFALERSAEQLSGEDWIGVVKTYESEISEGKTTVTTLHNLALARFKIQDFPQAVAVWVAAWSKSPEDLQVKTGLGSALDALNLTLESLDLQAHGPWQSWVARRGEAGYFLTLKTAIGILSLTCIFFVGGVLSGFFSKYKGSVFLKLTQVSLVTFTLIVWSVLGFYTKSLGVWGAVITKQDESVREKPLAESTELGKVKPGTPIYVVSDTYGPWLYIKSGDGISGWMNALSVRVVR